VGSWVQNLSLFTGVDTFLKRLRFTQKLKYLVKVPAPAKFLNPDFKLKLMNKVMNFTNEINMFLLSFAVFWISIVFYILNKENADCVFHSFFGKILK